MSSSCRSIDRPSLPSWPRCAGPPASADRRETRPPAGCRARPASRRHRAQSSHRAADLEAGPGAKASGAGPSRSPAAIASWRSRMLYLLRLEVRGIGLQAGLGLFCSMDFSNWPSRRKRSRTPFWTIVSTRGRGQTIPICAARRSSKLGSSSWSTNRPE